MSGELVLAVDHGTTGVKTSLVSADGKVLATESEDIQLNHVGEGGVEQDPELWWQALLRTGRRVMETAEARPSDVCAVAVSSMFSTLVPVGKNGRALMNAIMWLDTRGATQIRELFRSGFPRIQGYPLRKVLKWIRRTGGAPSLSGKDDLAHALYVKSARPDVYEATHQFLPSKDYLNLRLTGRWAASFDSVTLFWLSDIRNVHSVHYDDDLVREAGIARSKLPNPRASTDILGGLLPEVAKSLGLSAGTPVVVSSPDHQAAGIGAGSVREFDAHLYVGTSSWIQCTVPFKKTDIFHSIASLPTAIPGMYYCANEQDLAGGCLEFFLKRVLFAGNGLSPPRPADAYTELNAAAARAPAGAGNVVFTPWLNGERTPVDDPHLRGGFFNLSMSTTQDHLVRAVMEGVAQNARWNLHYVEKFIGRRLPALRIVGGGALSDIWCQIFSDVMQVELWRLDSPRAAPARGAAMIALSALGKASFQQVADKIEVERTFYPDTGTAQTYDKLFKEFVKRHKQSRTRPQAHGVSV